MEEKVGRREAKNINDLNERGKRSQRKAWKRRQQASRERKRTGSDHPETPPDSPEDQAIHEPARSRQAVAGERERRKTRARYSREVKAMRNKLQEVTKDRNKMKKRWVREQARNKKTTRITKKKNRAAAAGKPTQKPLHQENSAVPQRIHS